VEEEPAVAAYSVLDSAPDVRHEAKWLFPQEKAALHDLQKATCESKTP
jgi:hypothetical protein